MLLVLGLSAALAVTAVLVLTTSPGGNTSQQAAPPYPSTAKFANSVGVAIHLQYTDTAYRNVGEIISQLHALGVTHVRDGLASPQLTAEIAALRRLRAAGIGADMIVGTLGKDPGPSLAAIRQALGPRVDALEGPNEPDNVGGPNWPALTNTMVSRLRGAIQSSHGNRSLVAPSFINPQDRKRVAAATAGATIQNIHPYPGGDPPELSPIQNLSALGIDPRRQPTFATETGYHNALKATTGQPPVSESAAAVYIPRLLLDYFRLGIKRTYIYELFDEHPDPRLTNPEQHFGLVRVNYQPKPAFVSLQRTLSVMRGRFGAGTKPILVRVNSGPTVRVLKLARADGATIVALWTTASVWDRNKRVALTSKAVPVTLNFARPTRSVRIFEPVRSASPVSQFGKERRLRVPVSADPLLVEVKGS
jgi:hypothetical protein